MPTPNALLDLWIIIIDASFIGFWALVGLAMVGGGVDLIADAWHRWRGR